MKDRKPDYLLCSKESLHVSFSSNKLTKTAPGITLKTNNHTFRHNKTVCNVALNWTAQVQDTDTVGLIGFNSNSKPHTRQMLLF